MRGVVLKCGVFLMCIPRLITSLFGLAVAAAAAPKLVEPVLLLRIRFSWGWCRFVQ